MPYLDQLKNHIDITHIPFSDRGSRLLVFKSDRESRLYVKLAERLTGINPDIEAYLHRPAFITDICLIDDHGSALDFEITTTPFLLTFHTRVGEFGMVFQDERTLAWCIPPNTTAGLRFHVSPQYWDRNDTGGTFKSIHNVTYHTNGKIKRNKITPRQGGYTVELIVNAEEDSTIIVTIYPEIGQVSEFHLFSQSRAKAEERWQEWFKDLHQ